MFLFENCLRNTLIAASLTGAAIGLPGCLERTDPPSQNDAVVETKIGTLDSLNIDGNKIQFKVRSQDGSILSFSIDKNSWDQLALQIGDSVAIDYRHDQSVMISKLIQLNPGADAADAYYFQQFSMPSSF